MSETFRVWLTKLVCEFQNEELYNMVKGLEFYIEYLKKKFNLIECVKCGKLEEEIFNSMCTYCFDIEYTQLMEDMNYEWTIVNFS